MHKKNKINRIHMDRMENQKIICQKVLLHFNDSYYLGIAQYYTILHRITPYSPLEPLVALLLRDSQKINKFTLRIL